MANPRYYQEPETDRTTEKLKQLAALKAMGRREEPPQGQQQRMALQLLDTIMSARQQQQQNSAQEATHNRNIDVGALVNLAPTSPVAMRALQNAIPALAQAQQQVTGEQTAEQARQLNPVLAALYQKGAPKPEVFDALKQTYPLGFESPAIPWDTLNQSLYKGGAQASGPSMLSGFGPNVAALANDAQAQTPLVGGMDQREGLRRNPALEFIYRLLKSQQAAPIPALNNIDTNPQDFGYPN